MAKDSLRGFSSAFDEMLKRNRRELDALGAGSSLRRDLRAQPSRATAPRPATPPQPTSRQVSSVAAPAPSHGRSEAERGLDAKLGPGWRHQILERFKDGDELIVRCRVTHASRPISRTQYGAAAVGGGERISGSAGGVSFSLGSGGGSGPGPSRLDDERAAEERATQAALAACARLL